MQVRLEHLSSFGCPRSTPPPGFCRAEAASEVAYPRHPAPGGRHMLIPGRTSLLTIAVVVASAAAPSTALAGGKSGTKTCGVKSSTPAAAHAPAGDGTGHRIR